MNSTLSHGDYLYISLTAEPDYGDIVVIERPENDIIKRVIAKGGDSLYMEGGVVYIMYSGSDEYVMLEESYVSAENNTPSENNFEEVTVPEGDIYVLGDNRDNSSDSRYYGCFSVESVVGVVTDWSLKYKSFFTAVHILEVNRQLDKYNN